jgi:hypothetical protein
VSAAGDIVNDGYDSYGIEHFREGMRIEMHPVTDFWMAGARYGTVVWVGREKIHVMLDRMDGVHAVSPGLLRPVAS